MAANEMTKEYIAAMGNELRAGYSIDKKFFQNQNVKVGLRNSDGSGVVAGVTKVGSVIGYHMEDGERVPIDGELYYRGINVVEMVNCRADSTFGYEEAVYLLLMGSLPSKDQLDVFSNTLAHSNRLPDGFFEDMILKAPSKNIMNKLARSVLVLYSYDENPDDTSLENLIRQSVELVARFPTIVADSYAVKRHKYDGKSLYIHNPKPSLSIAENFLRLVRRDKTYTESEARLLDTLLMLHAEHGGGNNSAFVCRSLASTGTDIYSCIAGAVGSLKGPLHGGAAGKVAEMHNFIRNEVGVDGTDEKLTVYLRSLLDGTAGDRSGKIYGLGHAVYTVSDPRAQLLKKYATELAGEKGMMDELLLMERIEEIGKRLVIEKTGREIPICANVDMYSGFVYNMLGIPEELYTPLFAIARIAGWCAHCIEEKMTVGRIMRPAYRSAVTKGHYVPIEER